MNELILNARQRLGAILKHHREERNLSVRNVADRVGVSVSVVEAWERGATTPNNYQRHKLVKMVNRRLGAFDADFRRAYEEEEAEARQRGAAHKETIMASNRSGSPKAPPVTTNLGAKLGPALAAVTPAAAPPAPPGDAASAPERADPAAPAAERGGSTDGLRQDIRSGADAPGMALGGGHPAPP